MTFVMILWITSFMQPPAKLPMSPQGYSTLVDEGSASYKGCLWQRCHLIVVLLQAKLSANRLGNGYISFIR